MSEKTTTETSARTGDRYELAEHLDAAAALSRALWRALADEDVFQAQRDAEAFRRLAADIEDHIAHAVVLFEKQESGGGDL